MTDEPRTLWVDRQLLVMCKAAGMLSQKDETGDPSVIEWAREQLISSGLSGGSRNPFVAPVHRLDRPVSGVLILARTSKAAARLSAQFREKTTHKGYLAVVEGELPFDWRRVHAWLSKDRQSNNVRAHSSPAPGFSEAVTDVQVIHRHGGKLLVAMFPLTGRPHQLRATLTLFDACVVGDLRYGASEGLGDFIALHSHVAVFRHPVSGARIAVRAPVPAVWQDRFPWIRPYVGMLA